MIETRNTTVKVPPHCAINCFPQDGLRYAIYSGPDGLADNRPHLLVDRRPISTNPYTSEATWDTEYLWRYTPTPTPRDQPVYLRPRSAFAGEIGWHSLQQYWDTEPRRTGHQILTSEFRRDLEDLPTHRFQSAWYPGPGEVGIPSRDGAYFRHFPDSGYRARTSFNYYRPGTNHSSAMSGSVASNSYRRWKRAPAATEITVYDADNVSAEQSEEGGSGSFEQGVVKKPPRLLKSRAGPSETSGTQQDFTSEYTSYSHLDSPPVSQRSPQHQL